jgi:hypothetical protein
VKFLYGEINIYKINLFKDLIILSNMTEIWKDIKNYENYYKISNTGKIIDKQTNELLTYKISDTYYKVYLKKTKEGKGKYLPVHRLVAQHFIDNISSSRLVEHIDKNKSNNSADNLKWINYPYKSRSKYKLIEDANIGSEIWKEIALHENKYAVSDHGRIKNIITNSIIKPFITKGCYFIYISDGKTSSSKNIAVHQIVAKYFLENPNNYTKVEHKDGNKLNNKMNNLQWVKYVYDREKYKKNLDQNEIKNDIKIEKINIVNEEWSRIKNYNNYMISNFGHVKNIRRNRQLTPVKVAGYYTAQLCRKNGKKKRFRIHDLVGHYFLLNDDPINNTVVDHIDNDKLNNHIDNLRWFTQPNNIKSFYDNFKKYKAIIQYDLNMNMIKKWDGINDVLKNYNYKRRTLYLCLNKKCCSAYGYKWQYEVIEEEFEDNYKLEEDELFINIGYFGYKDFSNYEISNYGKVKSLYSNKILKLNNNLSGYYNVMLYDKVSHEGSRVLAHRLVASTMVIGQTTYINIVNHIDENKHNNYYKNLEWTTSAKNTKYSLAKSVKMMNIETGELIKTFDSMVDAVLDLGYTKNHTGFISRCCNKKINIALGYRWEFNI